MTDTIHDAELVEFRTDMTKYQVETAPRGDPAYEMTRSRLASFDECPARWWNGYGVKENTGMRAGSLLDMMVSGDDSYIIQPETYTATVKGESVQKPWNNNATVCKEWRQEHKGQFIVTQKDVMDAGTKDTILRNHPESGPIIQHCRFAALIKATYTDPDTGLSVPIKTALDIVQDEPSNALHDLKTGRDANPRLWSKACWTYAYDMQAGLNLDLWNAATADPRDQFFHIIQESAHPYHVEVRQMDPAFIDCGRRRYLSALARYCRCVVDGVWPGYAPGKIEPADWMMLAAYKQSEGVASIDQEAPEWYVEMETEGGAA